MLELINIGPKEVILLNSQGAMSNTTLRILSVKGTGGGGYPLYGKIRKVVFEVAPKEAYSQRVA